MTNSFYLEALKLTVTLNSEERGDSESIIRLNSGQGERERIGVYCWQVLSLARLARMTNFSGLDTVKATVILNSEGRA
ncbi:hypothetical protein R7Q39_06925 [Vibrio sp. 947]|uniref:hypothetical protein n=1 Tax=Vibrio sp. 947 TaxID=3074619 RepID=UPI00296448C2|nr:hypothetical protein [Vibrio sp. 947]MDW1925153.1 hypothetical protein [Vibrio sp. 947]